MLRAVPPHESITPRRKQKFYDYAVETFNYGTELSAFKDSAEYEALEDEEKENVNIELELITQLNELQVNQISEF